MLIEFSVGNYRSFKEAVTFSMVAAPIDVGKNLTETNNLFPANKELNLLKSAAVYGANASGKSNLVRAISFMKEFTINSALGTRITDKIGTELYRLSVESAREPSYFEIVFMVGNTRYRYGFEVDREIVQSEWLYQTLRTKEVQLFDRNKGKFKVASKFSEGTSLQVRTRKNSLFLSVVAQFNGDIATDIIAWFNDLSIFNSLDDDYDNILKAGKILIVDELDARLHPLISCAIVKLFNSMSTNPRNAQLIFTTHDTNLLTAKLFRKDQVWFTEKNRYGATDLYSLVEYNIPNDAPFEQDYIAGRYGAIPFIGDLNRVLSR